MENYLANSFRVFERIQYRMSGFSMVPKGDRVLVSYDVKITGQNRRQSLNHEETAHIEEEVGMVDGKLRILRTLSGRQWIE